jgi:LPS-assembly lipoprotein
MTLPANHWYKLIAALCIAATLGGCGFQLRGSANLPWESLYVDLPDNNSLGAELKRNLRAGTKTRIVERRDDAQAIIQANAETRSKAILSLNSNGAVREFRLKYQFAYRIIDKQGNDIGAPGDLLIERDYSFNDNQVLAKESEEALLYRDMQTDMVQQIMRRLAAAGPAK